MTTKPQSTTEPELKPCRCGRKALIERFHDDDDPQPLFVATCEVCPVKTYDQFTAEEAARVWNEFVSATVNIPDGQWQHVQIKAGNPRVVAIQFETAEQATAFINSFAATPASAAPVVDNWSKESPKVNGVYWWRADAKDLEPDIHAVVAGQFYQIGSSESVVVENFGGEWLGPITPTAAAPAEQSDT